MTGNNKIRIRLQERDRHLLQELGLMRVIDREQAKVIGPFHPTSAANVRLLALTRAGMMKRMFVGGNRAVYRLSPEAERGGTRRFETDAPSSALFIEHQLAVNTIYLLLAYHPVPEGIEVRNWVRFSGPVSSSIPLIPDGFCEILGCPVPATFLEIDLGTEPQRVWLRKARLYLELATSGQFATMFPHSRFRVLVIAGTDRRIDGIRSTVSKITDRIFWFASSQNIHREGLWRAVWFRPGGQQQLSLI